MSNDGGELRKLHNELGVSIAEVAVAADLNPQTVYKVYRNGGANRSSVNRVRKTLLEFQERLSFKSKSVG